MHVMIIEQDLYTSENLKLKFKNLQNFTLSKISPNLEDAIDGVIEENPDIIIIATDLPDANCLEVLRNLAAYHNFLPILIIAAEEVEGLDAECVRAGAEHYLLAEPLTAAILSRHMQTALIRKNREAQKAQWLRQELSEAQNSLVQAEKMAALGNLVAGIAHEINTPIGIGITAMSHLESKLEEMRQRFDQGKISKAAFQDFLERIGAAAKLVNNNLHRSARLIQGFKQIAVNQSNEEKREFELIPYILDVITFLNSQLKDSNHKAVLNSDADCIVMNSYPEILRRVLSMLSANAVSHAFLPGKQGVITIDIQALNNNSCRLRFMDDGLGIEEKHIPHIFDPFYTTKRGDNSGLGLNIVYNLVTQGLNGKIDVISAPNQGACFTLHLPLSVEGFKGQQALAG